MNDTLHGTKDPRRAEARRADSPSDQVQTTPAVDWVQELVAGLPFNEPVPPRARVTVSSAAPDDDPTALSQKSRWRTVAIFLCGIAIGSFGVSLLLPLLNTSRRVTETPPVQKPATTVEPTAAPTPDVDSSSQLFQKEVVTPKSPAVEWRRPGGQPLPVTGSPGTAPQSPAQAPVGLSGRGTPSPPVGTSANASPGAGAPSHRPAVQHQSEGVAGQSADAGSLWLISFPAEASVYLDQQLVGRTPIAIPDIKEGAHTLRLDLAGYLGWTSEVQIRPGRRERLSVPLERAPNQ